jgi:hypothetical protein
MKSIFALALAFVASFSLAQAPANASHDIGIFAEKTMLILGTADARSGFGLSYASAQPEPRFAIRHHPAQIVYEGYYEHTSSGAVEKQSNSLDAYGGLSYARWHWHLGSTNLDWFTDLGWGFEYGSRHTYDLDSLVNSTPVFDVGTGWPIGKQELTVTVRYLHMSNGGTVKPNDGQNQLILMAGVRF